MQRILELDDAVPEIGLRIHDRRVVDRRADLLDHEVEEELGRQLAQLVLQLLGEVATDRRERLGACVGGSFSGMCGKCGDVERRARAGIRRQEQPSTYSTDGMMPAR